MHAKSMSMLLLSTRYCSHLSCKGNIVQSPEAIWHMVGIKRQSEDTDDSRHGLHKGDTGAAPIRGRSEEPAWAPFLSWGAYRSAEALIEGGACAGV